MTQVSDLDKLQFIGLTRINININLLRFALCFEHELPWMSINFIHKFYFWTIIIFEHELNEYYFIRSIREIRVRKI